MVIGYTPSMELKSYQFDTDGLSFIAPTWPNLSDLAYDVSQKIRRSGRKFDRLVTLAKGGWPMACTMVDLLGIKEVASIGVRFYAPGFNQRLDRPKIYQDLPVSVKGENILLYDDVADTGHSLQFVTKHLLEHEQVAAVTTATLFYKPHSILTPDYYGAETKSWIIFPYDSADTVRELGQLWLKQGLSRKTISQRLIQLHISQIKVDAYWPEGVCDS